MPEAGLGRRGDRVPGAAGIVVGDRQDEGPRDRGGVAADLGAELIQHRAPGRGGRDVTAGEVPHIGVLGDHAQRAGGLSADHDRRMRPLDRLGVAERPGEVEVGAVEVERLIGVPQPLDDRARLGQAPDRVAGAAVGQAVGVVLAPGPRDVGPRTRPEAELEPAARHDVRRRGDLGQQRGRPDPVARHQQAQAQPAGLRGEGRQQGPALEDGPVRIAADRQQVVEQPRMPDLRDRVRLPPDAQQVVIADLLRRGREAETRLVLLGHGRVPLSSQISGTSLRSRYGTALRFAT